MKIRNRIYCKDLLCTGSELTLTEQSHYIANVLRARAGDVFILFNERDGNYYASVLNASKKEVVFQILQKPDITEIKLLPITLYFAPIKNASGSFIVQKATELGVEEISPFYSERSVVRDFKCEKYERVVIEAVEQSGWINIPKISPILKFTELLQDIGRFDNVLFCDENEGSNRINAVHGKVAVVIGPEGGFNDDERAALRALKNVKAITISKSILRAETAIISALTLVSHYIA